MYLLDIQYYRDIAFYVCTPLTGTIYAKLRTNALSDDALFAVDITQTEKGKLKKSQPHGQRPL